MSTCATIRPASIAASTPRAPRRQARWSARSSTAWTRTFRATPDRSAGCLHNMPRTAWWPRRCFRTAARRRPRTSSERLVNITQSAFARLGDGHGLAEGGTGLGAGMAVLSGKDHRRNDARYVNRMMLSTNGGPASPTADGWVNYAIPVIAGLMYRDSVEIDELKHPFRVETLGVVADSAGAGRFRGAPAQEVTYAALENPVQVVIPCDGQFAPPRGVNGGRNGTPGRPISSTTTAGSPSCKSRQHAPAEGPCIRGRDSSGGGYGDPLTRDPGAC